MTRAEMKGIVENLFHLIAESRREDKSPKEVTKRTGSEKNLQKKNPFFLHFFPSVKGKPWVEESTLWRITNEFCLFFPNNREAMFAMFTDGRGADA